MDFVEVTEQLKLEETKLKSPAFGDGHGFEW